MRIFFATFTTLPDDDDSGLIMDTYQAETIEEAFAQCIKDCANPDDPMRLLKLCEDDPDVTD